jgi:hypothetical protein
MPRGENACTQARQAMREAERATTWVLACRFSWSAAPAPQPPFLAPPTSPDGAPDTQSHGTDKSDQQRSLKERLQHLMGVRHGVEPAYFLAFATSSATSAAS